MNLQGIGSAGRVQVVWWREWIGVRKAGPYPAFGPNAGCIYRWRLALGWVEIRRWDS